ncbi:MAG TPA: glycoside hydrolase family 3 N-terminal domain-containing protein [Candidatus Dormibacteraeota bacterium]|nr:glycoside hydrolase family 3 N-terminal domain-containing protein [Candidatus Dormibacteraeota bacterium]
MATSTIREARSWLQPDLPIEERVEALLDEMSLAEKVGQTHQTANVDPVRDADSLRRGSIGSSLYASGATAGNTRDNGMLVAAVDAAQRISVEESRLGIPLLFARDVIHGHRTVFPIPLGLAAAWDEDLVERAARIAAEEASADGIAWTFAPMVDISADPRWGRVAESFGEAPELAGRLAQAMVRGFEQQKHGLASCAKHYVGYGLVSGGRDYDSAEVGENTLRNLHLRPFRAAIQAGCSSIMVAFIDLDGIPMHAHRRLLREVLKDEWGFEGVVVSDWRGVGELVEQGVAADLRDAAVQAIRAGIDMDMASGAYATHLAELVESGVVPVALLDDAVRRILRMKLRRGLFEQPYTTPSTNAAPSLSSRKVAREAAAASFVLLSNRGLLPLESEAQPRVLLTGPFADDGEALLGTWTLDGRGEDVITPARALAERLRNLTVDDGRFSDRMLKLARQADITIAFVGEHPSRSGEANSISTLGLPPGQLDVVRQVAALGKPLIVVVFTGRPLDVSEVLTQAGAVLLAWHPGIEAGPALADVILGEVSPRGRLPMTFPRSAGHVPSTSHRRPTGRPLDPRADAYGGRYIDALAEPLLPFGWGLTYATFRYGPVRLSAKEMPVNGGSIRISVDVTNTGARRGREVVQLYLRDLVASVTRPLRQLTDWVALELEPGSTATASFVVTPDDLGYYDRNLSYRVEPGEVEAIVGPDAAHGTAARLSITG